MVAFHSPPEPSPSQPPSSEPERYLPESVLDESVARERESYAEIAMTSSAYRSPAPRGELGALQWSVTRWQKLYVRIARGLWDVRAPYREGRAWRKYQRALLRWEADGGFGSQLVRPAPPPAYVLG